MPGRAVPQNRPQAGINCNRTDLLMILPALYHEDIPVQNPAELRQNAVAVINRGAPHVVPGPGLNDPAAPNVHLHLQIDEQADVQAMRAVLERRLRNNIITARHFRMAFTRLSAMLPIHGPYRIPEHQMEYARILRRMARVMTLPCTDSFQCYDDKTIADLAVECPFELRDCVDKLLEAMSVAFSLTRGCGVDGVVFVAVKDREAFASALESLASRLEPRPFS